MTTKNISKKFEALRSHARSHRPLYQSSDDSSGGNLLPSSGYSDELTGTTLDDLQLTTLPPRWVDIVGEVKDLFIKFEAKLKELQQAYDKRLKVTFNNDDASRDEVVEQLTHEVTMISQSAEKKIRAISNCDKDVRLTPNESNIRLNVMRHLGNRLSEMTRQLRQNQQEYLSKLRSQQQIGGDLFAELDKKTPNFLGADSSLGGEGGVEGQLQLAMEQGLNDDQLAALEEMELRADEREKAIIHLVQNVNEISSLVQELNLLVIQQGTILDRIDYNVEQSYQHVVEGRIELEKAEEISKSNWMLKIMIGLFVLIIIEVIILVIKYKKK